MADEIRQKLGFDVGEALRNLSLLRQSLGQTSQSLSTLAKNGGKLNQLSAGSQRSLQQATTAVTNFGSQTRAAAAGATPHVHQLTVSFETLARVVQTQVVVRAMSALRDALRESVGEFIEFEKAIAQIETISGDTFSNFGDISATARDLAVSFNTPVLEQARALYEAVSNQVIKTKDDLDLLTQANLFAQATNSSVAASSSLLAGAINAYGLETKDAGKLASQFFVTLDKGAIEAEELATAFGRVAPLARNVGVSIAELNAALATLTIGGVKPAESATQLRGILSDLVKPTESMTKAFRELGVANAEELIQARGLIGALLALNSTTDGSTGQIAALFDQVRGLSGELALTKRGLVANEQAMLAMIEASSDLASEKGLGVLAKQGQTVERELNKLSQTFKQEVGEAIVTTTGRVLELANHLGGTDSLIELGRALGPVMRDAAIGAGALAAALAATRLNALRTVRPLTLAASSARAFGLAILAVEGGEILSEQLGDAISKFLFAEINAFKAQISEHKKLSRERTAAITDDLRKQLEAVKTVESEKIITIRKTFNEQVDAAKIASEETREALKNTLSSVTDAQQKRITELRQTAAEAARAFEDSVGRATDLKQSIEDLKFEQQFKNLTDPQKFAKLLQTAQRSVVTARRALTDSADPKQVEQIVAAFGRAEDQARRALDIAEELGDRRGIQTAEQSILNIKKSQLVVEGQLQQKLHDRERAATQAATQEKQRLDRLKTLSEQIVSLSTPFEKDELLTEEDRQKRKADLSAAVKQLFTEVRESDRASIDQLLQVANLGTRINEQLTKAQIQQVTLAPQAFQSIVDQFAATEITLNVKIKNVDEEVKRLEDGIKAIDTEGAIRERLLDQELDQKLFNELGKRIQQSTIHNLFSGDDVEGMRRIAAQLVDLQNQGQLTRDKLRDLFRQFRGIGADGVGGTDPQLTQLFQLASKLVSRAEQLNQISTETTTIKDNSAATAVSFESIDSRSSNTLNNLKNMNAELRAMQGLSTGAAVGRVHGGLIRYLASGGFAGRGTDRIHALLSEGEFVVNARSSRRFFSQLQAINAGQALVMRNQGGSVTNVTIGDVNVQGGSTPAKTGRAIATELRRELRRGSIRGF
jgi:TP901 family phage tail tape measure protein